MIINFLKLSEDKTVSIGVQTADIGSERQIPHKTISSQFIHLLRYISDDIDDQDSLEVLERLETIDSETDNMDVTIVKMGDPRYARKWGVTNLPSVVYFRNRFPSIYRGKSDLLSLREKALEQKN